MTQTTTEPTNKTIEIATKPPKWVAFPKLWEHLVFEANHETYGAAVAHYRSHQRKYGMLIEQRQERGR